MPSYVIYGRGSNHCLVRGPRSLGPLGIVLMLAWLTAFWLVSVSTGGGIVGMSSMKVEPPIADASEATASLAENVSSVQEVRAGIAANYMVGAQRGGNGGKALDLDAFELINMERSKRGRAAIGWDEGLYLLALYRSTDMDTAGYLDHVDPEGRCAKTLADRFDVQYVALAENIYGISQDRSQGYVAYPSDAVGYWMASRSHRYNLLYEHHSAGALACYKSRCTFIGANDYPGETIPLGGGVIRRVEPLGAGGCHTAAEGEAFWDSAPRQEGEI